MAPSSTQPSKLANLKAEEKISLRDDVKTKLFHTFCGTGPNYIPPNVVPYTKLLPAPDDNDLDVVKITELLYRAHPAFGLVERLPEKSAPESFVLNRVAPDKASVEEAWASTSAACSDLYQSATTNTRRNLADAKIRVSDKDKGELDVGVTEFKASTASAVDGLSQAVSYATDMALALRDRLPLEDILMPFLSYTAAEELHGVVYLLEGGAPCYVVLAVNRLDNFEGCKEAARWRKALVRNGRRMANLVQTQLTPGGHVKSASDCQLEVKALSGTEQAAVLDVDHYFLKPLLRRRHEEPKQQGAGRTMYHNSLAYLEMYEQLRVGGVPAALPLARLTTGTMGLLPKGANRSGLPPIYFVFEDLAAQGFWSGVPQKEELFLPWLLGAMDAVRLAHAAGVVHLDTHFHNFMWREIEKATHKPAMATPPGAKARADWTGHKDAARLALKRTKTPELRASSDSATAAAAADAPAHFKWPRAGDVATMARKAREERESKLKDLPKVDVVLIDWDLGLSRLRPVLPEEANCHYGRGGWFKSLELVVENQLPPTAPDWDFLRTTLALWLRDGPLYEPFTPLARRSMEDKEWAGFVTLHNRLDHRVPLGGLGARGGLRATLKEFGKLASDLELDRGRLQKLTKAASHYAAAY